MVCFLFVAVEPSVPVLGRQAFAACPRGGAVWGFLPRRVAWMGTAPTVGGIPTHTTS